MKKIIAILCLFLVFGLISCGNSEDFDHTTLEVIMDYTYIDIESGNSHTIRILKKESDTKYISQYQFEAIENKDTEREIIYRYNTKDYKKHAPQTLREFINKDKNLEGNDVYNKIRKYTTAYNIQIWTEGQEAHTYKSAIESFQANVKIKELKNSYLKYVQDKTNTSTGSASVAAAEFILSEIYESCGLNMINTLIDADSAAKDMIDDVNTLTEGIEGFADYLGSITEDWDKYLGPDNIDNFERKKADLRDATINAAKELYNAIKSIGAIKPPITNAPSTTPPPPTTEPPQTSTYLEEYGLKITPISTTICLNNDPNHTCNYNVDKTITVIKNQNQFPSPYQNKSGFQYIELHMNYSIALTECKLANFIPFDRYTGRVLLGSGEFNVLGETVRFESANGKGGDGYINTVVCSKNYDGIVFAVAEKYNYPSNHGDGIHTIDEYIDFSISEYYLFTATNQ